MSYILEALKKLEQKRQQEGTPNLLTLQGDVAPFHKKRTRWPYFISGIIITSIVTIAALFWFGPWNNNPQSLPPKSQLSREVIASPQPAATQIKQEEPIAEIKHGMPSHEKKDITQPLPSPPSTPLPAKVEPERAPPSKALSAQLPPATKAAEEPTPKATKPVLPSKKVVSIKELPPDVKNKLPELKMTVHSYNEQPQSRFAVINNTTLREGQSLNGELKMEQISQSGVVMNYQGHRFTLGINENP